MMFENKNSVKIAKLTAKMKETRTFDGLLALTEELKDTLLETYKVPSFYNVRFLIRAYSDALSDLMYKYGGSLDEYDFKTAMEVYDPCYNNDQIRYEELPEEAQLYELISGFGYDFSYDELFYGGDDDLDDPIYMEGNIDDCYLL